MNEYSAKEEINSSNKEENNVAQADSAIHALKYVQKESTNGCGQCLG